MFWKTDLVLSSQTFYAGIRQGKFKSYEVHNSVS